MHRKIIIICGESEITPDFDEIGNNPNFIFENDPNFETVRLFDIEGNIVNVNSWLECANYVNGGWTNNISDFYDGEKLIFGLLLVLMSSLYFIGKTKYRKYWSDLS